MWILLSLLFVTVQVVFQRSLFAFVERVILWCAVLDRLVNVTTIEFSMSLSLLYHVYLC